MTRHVVQTGIERLIEDPSAIAGKRVAVLSHQAAITRDFRRTVDCVAAVAGANFVRIFGPEHGFWGVKQDMEGAGSETDAKTSLPIESLYLDYPKEPRGFREEDLRRWERDLAAARTHLWPEAALLRDVEVLVVDLQDVGSRYYTFANTMANCMEVAKTTGTRVVVLDRPNPINGLAVEGNVLEPEYASFVGQFPLPARHGMTICELARFYRAIDAKYACDLHVVEMRGWSRTMWFDQTGLPWVPPSPNMPSLATATVYPGMCLLEATAASEGRGTTIPFEIFGAPGVDPFALAERLNASGLRGVRFRPQYFQPTFQKHAGRLCGGVQVHVTDRDAFAPYLTGLVAVMSLREAWPSFEWRREAYEYEPPHALHALEQCVGSMRYRGIAETGSGLDEWIAAWDGPLSEFMRARGQALLYR